MGTIRTVSVWRVTLLYCALTLILAYPLTKHPASRVLSVAADGAGPATGCPFWSNSEPWHGQRRRLLE